MKKNYLVLIIFLPAFLFGQKLAWKAETDFFFDNTEYAKSSYTIDQTMAGIHFSPQLILNWKNSKDNYSLNTGINLLKKLGSTNSLDKAQFLVDFQYDNKLTLFKAGVFNRADLLDDYSNFFFQDSVRYYHPVMEGLYLKRGNKKHYFKLWLDWTGLQSDSIRESFFLGASAFQKLDKHFFVDFQSYLYHFAGTRPSTPGQHVCENIVAQTSVGYSYKNKNIGINNLLLKGGIMTGFERNRVDLSTFYTPIGFVGEADIQYKRFGLDNLLYAGQPRMILYDNNGLGNQLYWGNPFLRGNFYLQSKLYWKVFDTKYVSGELASRQHFSEGNFYVEQLFTLSAKIGK